MKCPICEGDGFAEMKDDYGLFDCKHCHGTGEIQQGDWWKVQYPSGAKSVIEIEKGKHPLGALEFFFEPDEIKLICRMKEVE